MSVRHVISLHMMCLLTVVGVINVIVCQGTLCEYKLDMWDCCLSAGVPDDNTSHWFRVMQWHGENRSPRHSVRRPSKTTLFKDLSKLTCLKTQNQASMRRQASRPIRNKEPMCTCLMFIKGACPCLVGCQMCILWQAMLEKSLYLTCIVAGDAGEVAVLDMYCGR